MQEFARKRDALFASLDDASKDLKGTALDQSGNIFKATNTEMLDSNIRRRSEIRRRTHHCALIATPQSLSWLRGKESIFKKPELPITKCLKPRQTPDYEINPHKWKKYTLSDVDISEQTNNRAAVAFLAAIDEQRAKQEETAEQNRDNKIQFKKISTVKRKIMPRSDETADEVVDKPHLKGTKFVMPQYVVGQHSRNRKKKETNIAQKKNTNTGKQLNLSHLIEYDEE